MALVFACGITWNDVVNCGLDIRTCQEKIADICVINERLKEERERLNLTQPAFAEAAGAKKRTLIDWEKGVSSPTGVQLAALAGIGVDVSYVLTGQRTALRGNDLSNDERELLALFRAASLTGKAAAIGALQGAAGAGGVVLNNVTGSQTIAGRDMTITRGKSK